MAEIDRERWLMLQPLINEALELSGAERAAWLASLDSRAAHLAADVRALVTGFSVTGARDFLSAPLLRNPRHGLAGTELGDYRLERSLGSGGMGSVWLATHIEGRFAGAVAIKLLNLALLNEAGRQRFSREASVLARLTHPGIARLLDTGVSAAGQPYLVLEYVDGVRIDEWATSQQLSRTAIVQLMQQVIAAVAHAHLNQVVHRDLKPSNILVTADGVTTLLDFGIAKLLDAAATGEMVLTANQELLLTPDFASPEQVRCEPVTAATDVYNLGVLLYLLLSGRHPTSPERGSVAERIRAVLTESPPKLGIGGMDAILQTALRKKSAERYQTATALGDDLARFLRGERITARY